MRYLTVLLMIPALLMMISDPSKPADGTSVPTDFLTDIQVTVMVGGSALEDAVVRLDINNNGIWDEYLGEPQAVTTANGVADFGTIVSILDPGGDDPADIIDWQSSRILTGNLRGTFGAHDVQFEFVLPPGVERSSLALHDLRGRRLAQADGSGELSLHLPGNLPSGVYFVRLSAEPAAAVTHRITSVGQRAQTVRARQVSVAEAVAAGWLASRTTAGKQNNRDQEHPINVMVSHVAHGGMNQAGTVVPGLNEFTVEMCMSPAGFVHIPPGTFTMGSPEAEPGRLANEGPQHQVTLMQGFYMSKYEVAEEWWHQVMGGHPQIHIYRRTT